MKKTITLVLLCTLLGAVFLVAQIPNTSPIPVVVKVSGDDGYSAILEYGSMSDFGDTLLQTITAPLARAFSDDTGMEGHEDCPGLGVTDSLCTPAFNDLTGKIALIRRGCCNFSLKIYHAQQAGAVGVFMLNHNDAGGGSFGMAGGDSAHLVVIPAVGIPFGDANTIIQKVEAGVEVTGSFEVASFGTPLHAYAHSTPQNQILPMEDIGITYANIDPNITIPSLTLNAEITDPNGAVTTLTEDLTDIGPLTSNDIKFTESFTPDALGTYTIVYSNSLDGNTVERDFEITEYTWAQDIGEVTGSIGENEDDFQLMFFYDFGNFYRTGSSGAMATHVTFALANPESFYPEDNVFEINIYDADPDGNGEVPFDPDGYPGYESLDESGNGDIVIVGEASFTLSGTEQPNDFITVELDEPTSLDPNHIYLLMVKYDGLGAGTGIPPRFSIGGSELVAGRYAEAVFAWHSTNAEPTL